MEMHYTFEFMHVNLTHTILTMNAVDLSNGQLKHIIKCYAIKCNQMLLLSSICLRLELVEN